jgi:hypothetical protein
LVAVVGSVAVAVVAVVGSVAVVAVVAVVVVSNSQIRITDCAQMALHSVKIRMTMCTSQMTRRIRQAVGTEDTEKNFGQNRAHSTHFPVPNLSFWFSFQRTESA